MTPVSVFIGLVTEDGEKLILDFPKMFKAYYRRFAGHEVELEIRKRRLKQTDRQRKGFHAMITPWANDAGHQIDDLKFDLMGEVFGWSEKPSPLTGRQTPIKQHTSELTRDEYSTLIERTLEIAASCGYVLEAPNEYKERKKKEAKAAACAGKRGKVAA